MEKIKKSWFIAAVSMLFAFVLSETVLADTYYVPDESPDIQPLLDEISDYDTIIVRDGVYAGSSNKNLDFHGKSVTLRSENGPGACIIDCEGDGTGVSFRANEGVDAILDGFTIINGNNSGIICGSNTSPMIRNCIIAGNRANPSGGGIYCAPYASPTIISCTIADNSAVRGGGIFCDDSEVEITNCILWNNSATSGKEIYLAENSFLTVSYSNVDGGQSAAFVNHSSRLDWGVGNMDAEPLFVNELNTEYHLDLCSPCIDAGDPSSDYSMEQAPNGDVIDMGALENTSDATIIAKLLEDNDGDGYSECQGDCNDEDASIHPGAEDVLGDGIDQDCGGRDGPDDDDEDNGGSSGSSFRCTFSSSAHGTPLMDKLSILREFRDRYLLPYLPGKISVKFYYWSSPFLANVIAQYEPLRAATRVALIPTIWACEILLRSPEMVFMVSKLIGVFLGCILFLLTILVRERVFERTGLRRKLVQ